MLRPTQVSCLDRNSTFAYGTLTLFGRLSQYRSTNTVLGNCPGNPQLPPAKPSYPAVRNARGLARTRFRLLPFRSPLLRESLRFLLYPATEMFHFADFAPDLLGSPAYAGGVSPFGYQRIADRLRLPVAFRRSLRPSSATDT